MSPMQAIQAATRVNSELLKLDKIIGTLKPGKFADLIAVEGNPAADIKALRNVRKVMKNGRWVDSCSLGLSVIP